MECCPLPQAPRCLSVRRDALCYDRSGEMGEDVTSVIENINCKGSRKAITASIHGDFFMDGDGSNQIAAGVETQSFVIQSVCRWTCLFPNAKAEILCRGW